MRRFFLEKSKIENEKAILVGSEARHIGRVLRLGVGDSLSLFDGKGWGYQAVITAKSSKIVEVAIVKRSPLPEDPSSKVVLGQALPKAQKMDFIIQKATELGVSTISPFLSARSVPSLDNELSQRKHIRWKKVALEATKQCGRLVVPQIGAIVPFAEILGKYNDNSLKIMLWENEKNSTLKSLLKRKQNYPKVIFLVGPEGGFTSEEVSLAKHAGFQTVSLGRYILRAETVGLCLLSILHYEWGDME